MTSSSRIYLLRLFPSPVLIAVFCGFLLNACSPEGGQAPPLAEGNRHLAAERFDEAIRAYRMVLAADSLDHRALGGLARAYRAKENRAAADIYLRKAVRQTYIVGLEAQQAGETAKAIAAFEQLLEVYPDYPLALNRLGDIYRQQGKAERALAYYQQSQQADPEMPQTQVAIGTLLSDMGRTEEARRAFQRAIELDINRIDAYMGLGRLYAAERQWQEAAAQFANALKVDPQYAEGRTALLEAQSNL